MHQAVSNESLKYESQAAVSGNSAGNMERLLIPNEPLCSL